MTQLRSNIIKYSILAWIGGSTYVTLEVLYRGYSHWTMLLLAAIIFIVLGGLNEWLPWNMPLILQGIIGACAVTILEFFVGLICNVWLDMAIWNYSNVPFNVLGQICLPFSLLWVVLSIVAIVVDDYLRYLMFDEEFPHYTILRKK